MLQSFNVGEQMRVLLWLYVIDLTHTLQYSKQHPLQPQICITMTEVKNELQELKKQIVVDFQQVKELTLLSAKNVLTTTDVCLLTGLSKSHIYKLTCTNKIPDYKGGAGLQTNYFNKQEIENWLLKERVETTDEVEQQAEKYCLTYKK